LNNPRPSSEDPKLVENWSKNFEQDEENYKSVVKKIREQKI